MSAEAVSLLNSDDVHPVALFVLLTKTFGKEFIGWEPETLWAELRLTFSTAPSLKLRAKIQALRTCLSTHSPFEYWECFEACAYGLAGLPPRFDLVQQANPMQCIHTIDVLKALNTKQSITPEVWKYCAAALHADGTCYGPGSLAPANTYLLRLTDAGLHRAVQLLLSNRRVASEGGNRLTLQAFKAQTILDYSSLQKARLRQQLRLLGPAQTSQVAHGN